MPQQAHPARLAALSALGLSDTATARQITAAYRRLARTTHPDVTGRTDPNAAARFAEITAAYRSLVGDPHTSAVRSHDSPWHWPPSSPHGPRYTYATAAPWVGPPLVPGPVVITPCSDSADHDGGPREH